MNCKFANLKLALKKYVNVPKWEEEDTLVEEEEEEEKGEEACHTFIKIKFYFGKRPQPGKGIVSNILAHLLQNVGDKIGI